MLTKWVWKSHLPLVILEVSKCADLIIRFNLSSMNTKRLYYSHKLPILKKNCLSTSGVTEYTQGGSALCLLA